MTVKIKTITLTAGYRSEDMTIGDTGYRVEKITDSLEFTPGEIITKLNASELCNSRNWKVTITKIGG